MKVLVIGSGGREHALAWKLAQSAKVSAVYAAPGNGGTAGEAKCKNIPVPGGDPSQEDAQKALVEFAKKERIKLIVVGPETPLAAGIVDRFREAGLRIVGPDKNAARLEASKEFSKSFMKTYGVRSARSRTFHDYHAARRFTQGFFKGLGFSASDAPDAQEEAPPQAPLVIKADGLAAGKGVVVAQTLAEAEAALSSFMEEKSLGAAGTAVVLEEYIQGKEVSILAAVAAAPGKKAFILPFVSAKDHKRRFDGALGPNTGGMGAIAPAPDFSGRAEKDFIPAILEPTLRGISAEAMDYRGFIFFGLMIRQNRCYLLEYNVRLGDPETQAVLPLLDSDFAGLCEAIHDCRLNTYRIAWKAGAVCAPVAVVSPYPGPCEKGAPINIDYEALERTGGRLFIAGASSAAAPDAAEVSTAPRVPLITSGGRVLAASAWGKDLDEARDRAYQSLQALHFEGMDCRRDIGKE